MSKRQKNDTSQLFSTLSKEFHELVTNKQALRAASEQFLNNLVDELTLGIIFDYHRKYKTKAFDLDAKNCASGQEVNEDVFAPTVKKTQDCVCPICDKSVGAIRFAPHLEGCMGMKKRSRNARRGATNNSGKEKDNNTNYLEVGSDDEDTDWNPRDKRKKKKDRNGKKKGKGAPNKKGGGGDEILNEQLSVDIEGEEDELSGLRDFLQDHSNSSSPAESVSSSHSNSTKKHERFRNKKNNKRDRVSPNPGNSAA